MDHVERSPLNDTKIEFQDETMPFLFVSKPLLAYHSPFFNSLFGNEFKEGVEGKYLLKDMNPHDFFAILKILDFEEWPTDENVNRLLQLADRILMSGITDTCEKFLLFNKTISWEDKFVMADKFLLKKLQKYLLDQLNIKSALEVKTKLSGRYDSLNDKTLLALLSRMFQLGYSRI